jgi:hypothetical protein
MESQGKSRWLAIVSTISWVWGAILALISISLFVPMLAGSIPATGPDLVFALTPLLLAVFAGVNGIGLRRQRKPYYVIAIVTTLATIVLLYFLRVGLSLPGIFLNICILGVVLANTKRFS